MLPGSRTWWQKMCCMGEKGTGYHCWDCESRGTYQGMAGPGDGAHCMGCFTHGQGSWHGGSPWFVQVQIVKVHQCTFPDHPRFRWPHRCAWRCCAGTCRWGKMSPCSQAPTFHKPLPSWYTCISYEPLWKEYAKGLGVTAGSFLLPYKYSASQNG